MYQPRNPRSLDSGLGKPSTLSSSLHATRPTLRAAQAALELTAPGASTEVRFFAANLLLAKVRRDWGRLAPDARSHLAAAIRSATASLYRVMGSGGTRSAWRRARAPTRRRHQVGACLLVRACNCAGLGLFVCPCDSAVSLLYGS